MVEEYYFLKSSGCEHGQLPPVSRCYASLIDEIFSKHEWFNTPYFELNSKKRQRLEFFRLDENYYIDTRPPIYSQKGCVQIPLNYNISLYHNKCTVRDSKFFFNTALPTAKLRPGQNIINTLEHANSHGHFVTQIIPQIIHSRTHFDNYVTTIAGKNQRWYSEIFDFFEIEANLINFIEPVRCCCIFCL